jgi:hypothetical protein
VKPKGREDVVKLGRLDGVTVDTGPEMVEIGMTVVVTSRTREDVGPVVDGKDETEDILLDELLVATEEELLDEPELLVVELELLFDELVDELVVVAAADELLLDELVLEVLVIELVVVELVGELVVAATADEELLLVVVMLRTGPEELVGVERMDVEERLDVDEGLEIEGEEPDGVSLVELGSRVAVGATVERVDEEGEEVLMEALFVDEVAETDSNVILHPP